MHYVADAYRVVELQQFGNHFEGTVADGYINIKNKDNDARILTYRLL